MENEMFDELLESVRQAVEIEKGEREPSRVFHRESVKKIREKYNLSQSQFAKMLGVSVRTLTNWEQGHRSPTGAARVLLEVADNYPEALLDTVKKMKTVPA